MKVRISLAVVGYFLAFVFALAVAPHSRADGQQATQYLNSARISISEGSPQNALQLLFQHEAAELSGRSRAEHLGLTCLAYLESDDPASARDFCQQAIEVDTSRARWRHYNNLGIADFRLGNDAAARSAFESAAVLSRVAYTPRKNLETVARVGEAGVTREQLTAMLETR